MKRHLMTSLVALTAAMGAAQAADSIDAKQGGSMIVTYKDDVSTLDPAIDYDWQNRSMIKSLFDGLMDCEPGTTVLKKDLAEGYTISEDAKTLTLKLREGVTFHNGCELTAEDMTFSFDRVTNPETQSPGAGLFGSGPSASHSASIAPSRAFSMPCLQCPVRQWAVETEFR